MISAAPYIKPDIPEAFLSDAFMDTNNIMPEAPKTPGYYLQKIAILIQRAKPEQAAKWIKKLEEKYPELPEYQAQDLMNMGNHLLEIAEKILSTEELEKLRRMLGQSAAPAPEPVF